MSLQSQTPRRDKLRLEVECLCWKRPAPLSHDFYGGKSWQANRKFLPDAISSVGDIQLFPALPCWKFPFGLEPPDFIRQVLVNAIDYSSLFGGTSFARSESAKVRLARAAFTTPPSKAPWQAKAAVAQSLLSKISEAKRTKNFVEPLTRVDGVSVKDKDLQVSFTTFRALDRLNSLAKAASQKGLSDTERAALNSTFQMGMEQLRGYLVGAEGDKLAFAFSKPSSSAETIKIPSAVQSVSGSGILTDRFAAIPNVVGTETLTLNLSKGGASQSINVDLSTIGGPITLDALAGAVNNALAAQAPTFITRMTVQKTDDKWGFSFTTVETEAVSLQQASAGDALIVSSGRTPLDGVMSAQIIKVTDPTGALAYSNLSSLAAVDQDATDLAALQPKPKTATADGAKTPPADILAPTSPSAVATTVDGYSYVVGTTSGEMGDNVGTGQNDLFLSKLDSEGKVVWQRQLGAAGESFGSAITVDSQGNVFVTGSTTAHLSSSDAFAGQDAFVSKFNAAGDEIFTTQIDGLSASKGSALAVDVVGNIYLAGTVSGTLSGATGSGGDDGFLVKLSTTGQLLGKAQFGSAGQDSVSAIAMHPDGSLVLATTESGQATLRKFDLSSLADLTPAVSLGAGSVSSLAVDAATGAIAVGGATIGGLTIGTPTNGVSGYNDGFVATFDAALSPAAVTYLGTSGADSVDSLTFMNGALYAGGRTNGVLGAARIGATDGFVARLDAATGALQNVRQFGGLTATTGPVSIAAAAGGNTILGSLGLQQGAIAQIPSDKLVTQTSLRAGDSFSIKIGTNRATKITIGADDTYETLAAKIRLGTGYRAKLTLSSLSTGSSIKISAKAGLPVQLIAGPDGTDALSKLGLNASRLEIPPLNKTGALITPGGSYALGLNDAFNLSDDKSASFASTMLEKAIKTVQSGYRSLYWDDTKAKLVDGKLGGGSGNAYLDARTANYQAALARLSF